MGPQIRGGLSAYTKALVELASVSSHALAVSCGEMAQETTQPTKPLTRCHCLCLDARVDTITQRKQKHFEGGLRKQKQAKAVAKKQTWPSARVSVLRMPLTTSPGTSQPPTHLTGLQDTLLAFMPGRSQPRGVVKTEHSRRAGRVSPPAAHDTQARSSSASVPRVPPSHTDTRPCKIPPQYLVQGLRSRPRSNRRAIS